MKESDVNRTAAWRDNFEGRGKLNVSYIHFFLPFHVHFLPLWGGQ